MITQPTKFHTAKETAAILSLDVSRVLQLCRKGRLGYSTEKHGKQWVITDVEIARYQNIGPLPSGRPKDTE